MGMAASQARYLGLTARKTNVEYEGQQINQARTALGNQSAALWNQMLGLTIPTVPSITDFTELQYSFNDGIANYTISDIQSVPTVTDEDGNAYNKLVTYYFYEDVYKGVETTNSNPQVQAVNTYETKYVPDTDHTQTFNSVQYDTTSDKFTLSDGTELTLSKVTDPGMINRYVEANGELEDGQSVYSYTDADGNVMYCALNPTELATAAADLTFNGIKEDKVVTGSTYMLGNSIAEKYDPTDPRQQVEVDQLRYDFDALKDVPNDEIYKYTRYGQTFYTTKAELDDCIAKTKHEEPEYALSSKIDFQPALTQYYATTLSEKVENTDYAIMDDASGSGRYANIKLQNMSTKFNLKAEETTNQAAYNDAMNQYNYDLTKYEKQMSDINAKTSLIQEQDRTLELRLKQLETEQKALVTEMDAVKGVLQKNVESTFGTFK